MGASTPTHYALEELSSRIVARGPNPLGPTYVVLATDGKPNLCDFHDGVPASAATEREAVATLEDAFVDARRLSAAVGVRVPSVKRQQMRFDDSTLGRMAPESARGADPQGVKREAG